MVKDHKKTKLQYRTTAWSPSHPPGYVALPRKYPVPMQATYNLGYHYRPAFQGGRIVEVSESEHEYGEEYTGPSERSSKSGSDSDGSSSSDESEDKQPNVFKFLQPINSDAQTLVPFAARVRPPPLPCPPIAFGQPSLPYSLQPSSQPPIASQFCAQCKRARSTEYHRTHPLTPYAKPRPGICRRCKKKNEKEGLVKKAETKSGTPKVRTETIERELIEVLTKKIRVEVKDDRGAKKRYTVQRLSRSVSPLQKTRKPAPSRPTSTSPKGKKTVIYIHHKKRRSPSSSPPLPDRRSLGGYPPKGPSSEESSPEAPKIGKGIPAASCKDETPLTKSLPLARAREKNTSHLSLAKRTPLPPSTPSTGKPQSDVSPVVPASGKKTFSFRHVPAGTVLGTVRYPYSPPVTAHTTSVSTDNNSVAERVRAHDAQKTESSPAASPTAHRPSIALAHRVSCETEDRVRNEKREDHRFRWKRTITGKSAAVAHYQNKIRSHCGEKTTPPTPSSMQDDQMVESFSQKQRAEVLAIAQDCYDSKRLVEKRVASHPEPLTYRRLVPREEYIRSPKRAMSPGSIQSRLRSPRPLVIEIKQPPPHVIHVPADLKPHQVEKIVQRVTGKGAKPASEVRAGEPAKDPSPSDTTVSSNSPFDYPGSVLERRSRFREYVRKDVAPSDTAPSGSSTTSPPRYAAGVAAGPYHPLPKGGPESRARLFNEDGSMVTQATVQRPRLHNEDGTPVAPDTVLRHRVRNKDAPEPLNSGPKTKPTARKVGQEQQPVQETYYYRRAEYRDKRISSSPELDSHSASTSAAQKPRTTTRRSEKLSECPRRYQQRPPGSSRSSGSQSESMESPQTTEDGRSGNTIRRAARSLKRAITLTPRPRSALRDSSRRRRKRCSSSDDKYVDIGEQNTRSRNSNRPPLYRRSTDLESTAVHVGDAQHAHFDAKIIEREEINGRNNGRDYERDSGERSENEVVRLIPTKQEVRWDNANSRSGRAKGGREEIESMGWKRSEGGRREPGGTKDREASRPRDRENERSPSPFVDDDFLTAKAKAKDGAIKREWSRRRRISDEDSGG